MILLNLMFKNIVSPMHNYELNWL